ncbi:MAG: 2-succinyl-5-enolpyruvyl-6-hydroxy-3-cyclohexene-1-carboxylic-acid synthase [Wenzhouxiangellaceae bacterium]|nr:2-succinyl-5-enolpyruvyl-6-hydroxy-3-cyclohexene-1-carboxylic-acid synthase [Wenzhouxiangellaceae bacterium]
MTTRRPSTLPHPDPEPAAPNLNTLWARVIVDELARAGLGHVVISPGSRSAPLVFQFAGHRQIADHCVVDERSAAFFALGIARATRKPVALVCTTGTAAANYFPAVCEAERDRVPLLILSGARPPEDHDCGVQQVMDQNRLYGDHVRAFHSPGPPALAADRLAALRSLLARAWARTLAPEPGPVHIDLPFSKPLEPVRAAPHHPAALPVPLPEAIERAAAGRDDGRPWIRIAQQRPGVDPATVARLIERIEASRRPLIVAGADPTAREWRESLRALTERAAIPVLAEPASGLRHWRDRGDTVFAAADLLAAGGFYAGRRPDLVVHLGSAPLTWPVQKLMRECAEAAHVVVSTSTDLADPDHVAAEQVICDPGDLFAAATGRISDLGARHSGWLAAHREAASRAVAVLDRALGSDALSAPAAWHALGAVLPEDAALITSSSMVVRDLDCFMSAARQSLVVHFNRGLNGIDGVVSTALGVAAARARSGITAPTVLVIGDVALRHDIGALLLAGELDLGLTVVVIDNDGGEIFDYLPSAGFGEIHDRLFATRRGGPINAMLPRSVSLVEPADPAEFRDAVARALGQPELRVIRVGTDRARDQRLRAEIVEGARQALEGIPFGTPLAGA